MMRAAEESRDDLRLRTAGTVVFGLRVCMFFIRASRTCSVCFISAFYPNGMVYLMVTVAYCMQVLERASMAGYGCRVLPQRVQQLRALTRKGF